ncbi:four helix bundle protein [Flavobacterium alvei]|uniref:four helix bundle protein n=1 Tax=Flavobacterium alvei TaxID=2080416 RepID=UPI0026F1F468|nr:four helix bundle protein [Flavobacterium alvei]
MSENIIKTKSFNFALRIVKLYQFLNQEKREYVLSKQLLRSGTSVGALVREAEQAESRLDFIHKLAISQKEANESDYWLELLFQSDYLNEIQYQSLKSDIVEINKILASIIILTKQNLKKIIVNYLSNSQFTIHNSPLF